MLSNLCSCAVVLIINFSIFETGSSVIFSFCWKNCGYRRFVSICNHIYNKATVFRNNLDAIILVFHLISFSLHFGIVLPGYDFNKDLCLQLTLQKST